jgi:hypothetical protein
LGAAAAALVAPVLVGSAVVSALSGAKLGAVAG